MAVRFVEQSGGLRFGIKVVPGASRERIVGELGDALKIAVSKPARDGAANAAVVALLAAALGVPQSSIRIVRGHSQPRKEIFVASLSAQQAAARLEQVT